MNEIIAIGAIIISVLIYFAGVTRTKRHNKSQAKEKRINDFVNTFFSQYKGAGVVLELLVPSGIANLQNDDEIKNGFEILKNRLGYHPLRNWNDEIVSIGYKIFFDQIAKKGTILDKSNIENEIFEFKSKLVTD